MSYRDIVSEIVGTVPRLPVPLAKKYVNRSWQKVQDMRLWSWLVSTGDILAPAIITAGSVTATLGSDQVVLDGAASAAVLPQVLSTPPLAGSLGVGRQIRIGVTGSGGPIYSITAYDPNTSTITLDRPYANVPFAPNGPNLPYMIYKCYYAPPTTDFFRYLTVTNMRAGYTIRGKKLYYTQQKLNAVDSQRGGTGDAYIISAFKTDSSGRVVNEWYPHPVNSAIYNAVYQRRWIDIESNPLPASFPENVLICAALVQAADWALANVSAHAELANTNWVLFRQGKRDELREEVIQAIKQDDEIFPLTPFLQGSYFDFPLGGQFLQGHDVSSLIGEAQ